ncbi:hypothetical protein MMC17_007415 [Xylographa soralifera]|nr:hypothetical protein [Xylographa soralifera]
MEPHQTPDNLHLGNEKPTASDRAPRISHEEWDYWREKIEHLYIEEKMTKKELIEAMANEHGFRITEKQLKDRLRKSSVRKYLGAEDRYALVSHRRKKQIVDKTPVLKYRVHVIDSERVKRVCNRYKGLTIASPLMASSHIEAVVTPSPSPPPIEAGVFTHMNDTVAPLPLTSEADSFQFEDFGSHNAMDTIPEWGVDVTQEDNTNRSYLETFQALCDNPDASMMDCFGVPNLGPNYLQSWDGGLRPLKGLGYLAGVLLRETL